MARPERHDVDYFPFFAKRGRTLNILQNQYGLEGIGFFTNLMRFLALTPDHHYCIKDETDRLNFFAEIGITDENKGIEMIELMVKTEKLDKELWEDFKVIVSEAFLLSLAEAYKQRKNEIITMSGIKEKFISMYGNSQKDGKSNDYIHGNPYTAELPVKKEWHKPQSKVKKTRLNKSKYTDGSNEPPFSDRSKKPPLRERSPENEYEQVEKVYLLNWDFLFSNGKVKTKNPITNWTQTRTLLKNHFKSLAPDQIIKAVNNGLSDEFILRGGYSLATMLSSSVLNRLINSDAKQKHRIKNDNLTDNDLKEFFTEV